MYLRNRVFERAFSSNKARTTKSVKKAIDRPYIEERRRSSQDYKELESL